MKRFSQTHRYQLESLESRRLLSALIVSSAADSGAGSLRAQIAAAASSGDIISFAPSLAGQTITLTSGEIAFAKSLTIQGPGADQLTISGNNLSRVFNIAGGTNQVAIRDLTITRGFTADSFGGGAIANIARLTISNSKLIANTSYSGGAITNGFYAELTVINSTLSENHDVVAGYYGGGAIVNHGTMTLIGSTFSGNTAYDGGGAILCWTSEGQTQVITNCTFTNNRVFGRSEIRYDDDSNPVGSYGTVGSGGALYILGGATTSINHSTLAGNYAIGGYGDPGYEGVGYGGGIAHYSGGVIQLYDTIIADNVADVGPDLNGFFGASPISLGHNLIGNTNGVAGLVASDLLNVSPQLGALQNNGGPTQTMALLAGSPGINAGDNTNAPAYDQRGIGFPRIVGGTIDIGAFESSSVAGKTWIGPASGGNWSTAGNWNPAGVPAAGDAVLISAGSAVNVTADATARELTLAAGATLDLSDNALIINYSSASPIGSWNGSAYTGITGLIQANRITATIDVGIAETAGGLVIRATHPGDANLSGAIDGDDYFLLDSGYASQSRGYASGDFDYNGRVDADDYFLIDSNYHRAQTAPAIASTSETPSPALIWSDDESAWESAIAADFGADLV